MRRLYASLMRNDDAIMYVSFLVNGQWTTNEYLIDHVFRGRTVNRQYSLAAEPSMVKILVGEMRNGEWGIWKVRRFAWRRRQCLMGKDMCQQGRSRSL